MFLVLLKFYLLPALTAEPDVEQIAVPADIMICFTSAQAREALRETVRELSWSYHKCVFFL